MLVRSEQALAIDDRIAPWCLIHPDSQPVHDRSEGEQRGGQQQQQQQQQQDQDQDQDQDQ